MAILLFVFVLGLLVFVHELGHFWTARRLGVHVEEFGFGFPPRIVGRRRNGVVYSINWIPFGGFVRLKGEQAHEPSDDPRSFQNAPRHRRALIIAAGVLMNGALAMVLLIVTYLGGMKTFATETLPGAQLRDPEVVITSILAESPAGNAGLTEGAFIRSVNGESVSDAEVVRERIEQALGQPLTFVVERDAVLQDVVITPTSIEGSDVGKIGAGIETVARATYPVHWAILNAFRTTGELAWLVLVAFGTLVKDIVVHQSISADVAGPVGIAVLTGQVAQFGLLAIFQFMAILSISLMVINLMPFPGLDGGRLFFLWLEAIRKKGISQKTEAIIHNVGFVLLILLLVAVSIKDVRQFGVGERIADAVRSIFR
ncbi:MAG: site-2 protease family protein [Candidatus Kerfeldbacteria bacterium]|nr:site-2 protease family protein [Candidatus Kerfeldbacteria bacterium]